MKSIGVRGFSQKEINENTKKLGAILSIKLRLTTYKTIWTKNIVDTHTKRRNDAFNHYNQNPFVKVSRLYILDFHQA
jgi:hypothetical protein